jgi:hypothetical protein
MNVIAIIAYNRPEYFARTLAAIKKQDFGKEWRAVIYHDIKEGDLKCAESIKMAQNYDFGIPKDVIVNKAKKGVDAQLIFSIKESLKIGDAM